MKNRLKIFFKSAAFAAMLVISPAAWAQTAASSQQQGGGAKQPVQSQALRDESLDNLTFSEMINSVELDAKSADLIRRFQDKEGRLRLHNREYNARNSSTVETYRNKEVLLITIPASKLFSPNETTLRAEANALLAPVKRYLKDPDMYRVLLVMHTDNTGSEKYREGLTESRSTSVFDWFVKEGCDTRFLFAYSYGDEMPLVENNSLVNRDRNRRLEIYLVPGTKMLEQAKKGKIVY